MPEIKIQHIVSYSSQDSNNPADNLLKPDGVHKWKSAGTGEKSLSAILQFEKASRIHSIDIGNDGSAFIEVLVARSSSNEDFKVILVTSSFMTPMDSRNNTNRCSVRMFGAEKLTKAVSDEQWDRVKIICTQPFNKMTNYGLSFIKFHSPPSSEDQSTSVNNNPKKIGAFFFRRDEEDKDLKAGSLFARQKDKPENSPLTGAAAIRAASNQARSSYLDTKSSPVNNSSSPEVKKKRKHDVSDDEGVSEVKRSKSKNGGDDRSHSQFHERPTHQREESKKHKHATDPVKKDKKSYSSSREDAKSASRSSSNSSNISSSSSHKNNHHHHHHHHHHHSSSTPKSETTTPKDVSKSKKSLNKIMEAVVFVLSGFQNPFRADLRDKAKEMGANYRPDWSSDCTHLVCAFANTPKYNLVKGQGRIVTKHWILDSYRQRILLPWRKYQLEEKPMDEDDDDDDDEKKGKERVKKKKKEEQQTQPVEEEDEGDQTQPIEEGEEEDQTQPIEEGEEEDQTQPIEEGEEEDQTQPLEEEEKKKGHSEELRLLKRKSDPEYLPSMEEPESDEEGDVRLSEEDTDDEVRRIKTAGKKRSELSVLSDAGPSTSKLLRTADTQQIDSSVDNDDDDDDDDKDKGHDDEAFGAATDVDENSDSDSSESELPVLPNFLSDKHFFLYGNFNEIERHELIRYIIAYNGELEDYMNGKVDFVVTSEQWDDNFDEALSNYPQLTFVHPKWLYSCHLKNKWVPYQLHIVTPSVK